MRDGSEPSSTHTRWLIGRSWSSCTSPLGHRIDARTGPFAAPRPKKTSLLCCERNPDPACSERVWRPSSVSTVTTAPMASRLLFVPRRRKAIDGGSSSMTFFKTPQLRTIAILQKHFLTAIMIEIGERKCPPVFQKVQPHHARNIGERSIAVVRVENISLVSAPRAIRADQLVNRAPSLFVVVRRLGLVGRIGNHLPPEEAIQVLAARGR